jgi:hypothetical protein
LSNRLRARTGNRWPGRRRLAQKTRTPRGTL